MREQPESHAISELSGADSVQATALFHHAPHHAHTFLFSVLEGQHVGRIFVDDPTSPTAALVHLACEYTFLLGDASNEAFAAATQRLLLNELASSPAPYGQLLFLIPTTDAWHADILRRYCDFRIDDIRRKAFTFDPEAYRARHNDWRTRLPADVTLCRYDGGLAESAGGLAEFWGSIDRFLADGFGFALMRDGEPVSRCHTVLVGAGEAEISVETADAYRRRGLATLTACAFIDHALQRGLTPSWSCWAHNEPSVALARHLGFRSTADVPVAVIFLNQEAQT